MTAEQFRSQAVHKDPDEKLEGGFTDRVKTVVGTRQPSGTKRTSDCPEFGSVHRSSMKTYEHPNLDHLPYSTAHRNAEDPGDLSQLKKHQTRMLSDKQKRKNRQTKGKG